MVPAAEPGQVIEASRTLGGNGLPVVDLQPTPFVTTRNDALGVPAFDGGPKAGRNRPTGVSDGRDVLAFGHQNLEVGVVGQLACDADRDRPDTRDFALFP